jgi:hypothetical protein
VVGFSRSTTSADDRHRAYVNEEAALGNTLQAAFRAPGGPRYIYRPSEYSRVLVETYPSSALFSEPPLLEDGQWDIWGGKGLAKGLVISGLDSSGQNIDFKPESEADISSVGCAKEAADFRPPKHQAHDLELEKRLAPPVAEDKGSSHKSETASDGYLPDAEELPRLVDQAQNLELQSRPVPPVAGDKGSSQKSDPLSDGYLPDAEELPRLAQNLELQSRPAPLVAEDKGSSHKSDTISDGYLPDAEESQLADQAQNMEL